MKSLSVHLHFHQGWRKFALPIAASKKFAEALPFDCTFQSVQAFNKLNETLTTVTTVIMMDHDYRRLTQQDIKGKVLDSFPWIPPRKDRKIVIAHDRHVPKLANLQRAIRQVGADRIIIHRRHEITVL